MNDENFENYDNYGENFDNFDRFEETNSIDLNAFEKEEHSRPDAQVEQQTLPPPIGYVRFGDPNIELEMGKTIFQNISICFFADMINSSNIQLQNSS